MVKESDSKSDGLCPHRFESCRLRNIFVFLSGIILESLGNALKHLGIAFLILWCICNPFVSKSNLLSLRQTDMTLLTNKVNVIWRIIIYHHCHKTRGSTKIFIIIKWCLWTLVTGKDAMELSSLKWLKMELPFISIVSFVINVYSVKSQTPAEVRTDWPSSRWSKKWGFDLNLDFPSFLQDPDCSAAGVWWPVLPRLQHEGDNNNDDH